MTINKFFQYRFQINNQVFGFAHKLWTGIEVPDNN
jgi:hypothetical protein